jgi:phosphorylcholine metabolism protein LicD
MNSLLIDRLFLNTRFFIKKTKFGVSGRNKEYYESYNTHSKIDIDIAKLELELITKVFNKYKIICFLTHGTCLGAIRDSNFIKYDLDIDLGCYKKDINKIILALEELRDNYNFKIIKLSIIDESVTIIRNTVEIDINLYKNFK